MTKSFLTYSVEKLEKNSPPYQASCALWQDSFPLILPELLKFLRYAPVAPMELIAQRPFADLDPVMHMHLTIQRTGASCR